MNTDSTRPMPETTTAKKRRQRQRTPQERRVIAEALAVDNGGSLPCGNILRKRGFSWLVEDIRKHPSRYVDLLPDDRRCCRTPGEHLIAAEKLAKGNGGRLPSPGWLQKNGFAWLDLDMRLHPALYARLPQDRQRHRRKSSAKTPEAAANHVGQNGNCLTRTWKRLRSWIA